MADDNRNRTIELAMGQIEEAHIRPWIGRGLGERCTRRDHGVEER